MYILKWIYNVPVNLKLQRPPSKSSWHLSFWRLCCWNSHPLGQNCVQMPYLWPDLYVKCPTYGQICTSNAPPNGQSTPVATQAIPTPPPLPQGLNICIKFPTPWAPKIVKCMPGTEMLKFQNCSAHSISWRASEASKLFVLATCKDRWEDPADI